jgi:hypothetical protein
VAERIDARRAVAHPGRSKYRVVPGKGIVLSVRALGFGHFDRGGISGFQLAAEARVNEGHSFDITDRRQASVFPIKAGDCRLGRDLRYSIDRP